MSVVEGRSVEADGSFEFGVAPEWMPLLITAHAPPLATVVRRIHDADEPTEIFLPSDVATIVVLDPSGMNASGVVRTVVVIRQGLPLLRARRNRSTAP